ncbi:MAG: NAD-dependent epimerase/dehydratase family protein [Chloroflexi bacterium]|nr:MAG: NAD-dependent epimerase/dehydratase family protein [Chloroflexota bacterium]
MKIIVTGAAGFIGSHLSEQLAKQGHEVIGVDNFDSYYARELKQANAEDIQQQGVKLSTIDLAKDDLTNVLDGAEFIFHLAGQPGISAKIPFSDYVRNNLIVTQRLLEACKILPNLICFTNIATSSVYGKHATDSEDAPPQPTSYYGVTKLAAEQLALAYHREQGLPACSLRLFSVCGPRERPEKLYSRLIRCILEDEAFPLYEGSKDHSRSFTYVGDIINGFLAVLHHPEVAIGEIFNIGTDVEHTTGAGINMIEKIMGKKAKFALQPKRPGDQLRTCANIEKAGRLLGYEPQTTLEEALTAQVKWYKNRIHGRIHFKS